MNQKDKDELLVRLDERMKKVLQTSIDTLEQAKLTNGRVTKLESERIPKIEQWQNRMDGSIRTFIWLAGGIGVTLGVAGTIIATIIAG